MTLKANQTPRMRAVTSPGLNDKLGDLGAGVLLLTCDQPAVADGEWLETPALDVVGAAFPGIVLDVPRHYLLPDVVVGELLFDVREAGHRLALDQIERRCLLDQRHVLGRADEAHRDQIAEGALLSSRGSLKASNSHLPPSGLAIVIS